MSELKTIEAIKTMEKLERNLPVSPKTEALLRKLFSDPAVIVVCSAKGSKTWKTGKTDFALKLVEDAVSLGLVEEVATNIDTFGDYEYVNNLEDLKFWLHRNALHKVFILDEGNTHLGSRRAMTNKSVSILEVFPEISKARAVVIVVCQDRDILDSDLRKRQWVKAVFEKINKKMAKVISPLLNEVQVLKHIPQTTIKFDPYLIAPFTLKPIKSKTFKDADLEKLNQWANGKPWRELFKHPQECNRFVRSTVKKLLSQYSLFPNDSVEGKPQQNT
jgi:5'(3')-deoxyribonucleotidase